MFRCVNHLYKDLFIFYNMSACNKNLTTNFDFVNVYFVFAAKTHQNYEYYLIFLDTRLVVLSSIWNRYRLKRNIIQTINLPNPKRKEESEYEYCIEYFRTEYWLPIDKRYRFLMRGRNKRKMRVTKVNKVKNNVWTFIHIKFYILNQYCCNSRSEKFWQTSLQSFHLCLMISPDL